ncbi:nuclear transport factor 2 family protein [Candidatus Bipolaricaulota bacterium]
MNRQDEKQLLRILKESYVLDMYVSQETKHFSPDFHREFQILVPEFDGSTGRIADVVWLKPDPTERPDPKALETDMTFNLSVLDITGKVAVCKVEAFRNVRLQYTDYVVFTRIDREWKVVAKAFHYHLSSSSDTP